nr:methyltransferase domain-containing protein [Kofleriaceae bacterium]
MRSSFVVIALAACTPPAQQPCPAIPPPVVASAAVPDSKPTPVDQSLIVARTHELFDALDRADAKAFQAMVGPTFGRFYAGRFFDTAFLATGLATRADAHEPVRSRTWSDERVIPGPDSAVFIGEAVEHVPQTADHPAADVDDFETIVWVRTGADWKAALLQVAPAGLEGEKATWDATYRAGVGFNAKPNQLLVDTVKGRKPGAALDLAMGQGRNAVFLASQGWKVTGVDISDEGIKIAKDAAAKQKLKLDTVNADLASYDMGKDKWDLITMIYAGEDPALIEKIKVALKKGGVVVIEYFAKDATKGTGIGGFAPGELAHELAGWKIVKDEVADGTSDWGQRTMKLQKFVAEKP